MCAITCAGDECSENVARNGGAGGTGGRRDYVTRRLSLCPCSCLTLTHRRERCKYPGVEGGITRRSSPSFSGLHPPA